ncbi:MAG: hypothetical protein IPK82_19590 [Polyangiaceae bacterium]|nr:hypothetical protein [Polyangiaceae bacterium]
MKGSAPEVVGYKKPADEIAGVAQWLKQILNQGYKPRDIALFARTDGTLRDRVEPALEKASLSAHSLTDELPPSTAHASVGTMHRAKGLEFKVVVIMGCDADQVPWKYALKDMVDNSDKETFEEQERNLLYVAGTRARERLLFTYSGRPSKFLP